MSLSSTIWRWCNIVVILLPLVARSQQQEQEPDFEPRTSRYVFFEALPIFTTDTARAVAHIHYRIKKSFFVFVKDDSEQGPDRFVARGELLVELVDENKNSVAREVRQIVLKRASIPQAEEDIGDLQGVVVFTVPDGRYTILFRLDDRESGRSFLNRDRTLATRRPIRGSFEISYPFVGQLIYPLAATEMPRIVAYNFGGIYPFGSSGGYVLQVATPGSTAPISLEWKLKRERVPTRPGISMSGLLPFQSNEDLLSVALDNQEFSGTQFTLIDGTFSLLSSESEIVYRPHNSSTGWKILYIPLPLEKLAPWPRYRIDLKIISDGRSKKQTYYLGNFWAKRPRALSDPKLAIDALRHIATDKEMDEMLSGSFTSSAQAFFEFWRKRDPDTTTLYNEYMEEYYRRVDKANEEFSSLREQDGYRTDRGRIFILFGPPTRTNRILGTDNILFEVWIYENVGRRFTFMDRGKTGNFVLAKVEEL
jgi:GWxTD domain-containing protein